MGMQACLYLNRVHDVAYGGWGRLSLVFTISYIDEGQSYIHLELRITFLLYVTRVQGYFM